jgi:hypothetical protein
MDVQVSDTTGDAQGFAAGPINSKTLKMTAYSVFWQIFAAQLSLAYLKSGAVKLDLDERFPIYHQSASGIC